MRHYRCTECGEGFDAEPIRNRPSPSNAHCIFCGGVTRTVDSSTEFCAPERGERAWETKRQRAQGRVVP